ncbi:methylated-DNA--[protein]-cysteine S-methyltransferase [Caenispirillum bisanense]|uniref:methylated-DNA--[protein]-cysteine S-methyltransferase n=1 Tax=Caenispirillum bisanense TaxID=414052 RepID=UPI0031DBE885
MTAGWRDGALVVLDFTDSGPRLAALLRRAGCDGPETPVPAWVAAPLAAYFGDDPDALAAVPKAARGTPFQTRVWDALRTLRPGERLSYGAMAARLGLPSSAARAVGSANGANPISLVIPCHRLIGGRGALTGYAGGLHRKAWLLDHEAAGQREAVV